jgi:Fur family transcriptional regulator, ferric uptake regulator
MREKIQAFHRFQQLLEKKHLKMTEERKFIYDRISHLNGHFNADSLYDSLKKENAGIARGTVYRTIPLLLESGVIQKSVGEGKREFFERKSHKGHHDHIVCISCRKIVEFHCDEIEALQDKVCAQYGYKVAFHDHRIFGYCKDCQ